MGDKLLNYLLLSLGRGNQRWSCQWPQRAFGGTGGLGTFSFRKTLPFLVSIPCTRLRPGLVLSGKQDQPQHFVSVQRLGHVPLGPCCVPRAAKLSSLDRASLSPGALALGRVLPLHMSGAAPELLPSCEIFVLLQEWAKACESPEPWRSEAPSSATSSSVISGGAYTGTGLQPLPLSSRLRNCCCETPTALPDSLEG